MFLQLSHTKLDVYSASRSLALECYRMTKAERSRFFEVSRGSAVEVDTCFDLATGLNYVNLDDLKPVGELIIKTFKLLSGMIGPK